MNVYDAINAHLQFRLDQYDQMNRENFVDARDLAALKTNLIEDIRLTLLNAVMDDLQDDLFADAPCVGDAIGPYEAKQIWVHLVNAMLARFWDHNV